MVLFFKQKLTSNINCRFYLPWSVFVAGFQFSALMIGKQTCPFSSMFGWYILVLKLIFGGLNGYSAGKLISILKAPLLNGGLSYKNITFLQKILFNIPSTDE